MSIDYGMGLSNIDHATGIRYGVISLNSVASWFYDDQEFDYGDATCPECEDKVIDTCGENIPENVTGDYFCRNCYTNFIANQDGNDDTNAAKDEIEKEAAKKASFDAEQCFPEAPCGWAIENSEYSIIPCLDNDAFVVRSPYFTYAFFCSPCVPGAGSLDSGATVEDYEAGEACKAYCLGKEYFGEYSPLPYVIYSVETGGKVSD